MNYNNRLSRPCQGERKNFSRFFACPTVCFGARCRAGLLRRAPLVLQQGMRPASVLSKHRHKKGTAELPQSLSLLQFFHIRLFAGCAYLDARFFIWLSSTIPAQLSNIAPAQSAKFAESPVTGVTDGFSFFTHCAYSVMFPSFIRKSAGMSCIPSLSSVNFTKV